MSNRVEAPLTLYRGTVKPEWIDKNDHIGVLSYAAATAEAADEFFKYIKLGYASAHHLGFSIYALHWNITFLREVRRGANLRYTVQLIDYSDKLIHYLIAMHNDDENYVAATAESLELHISTATRRGTPIPQDRLDALAEMWETHKDLPLPPHTYKAIGIRKGGRRAAMGPVNP
ncbi:MAG: thioesterase family protein [Alphaproteobacteria bacterium]